MIFRFLQVTNVPKEASTLASLLAIQNQGNGFLINLGIFTRSSEMESISETNLKLARQGVKDLRKTCAVIS